MPSYLPDFVLAIRQDLSDTDATAYRWVDATIQREIDRTVDTYSYVSPYLQLSQVAVTPGLRAYGVPSGAWWVERVEWPLGMWPRTYRNFYEKPSPLVVAPNITTSGTTAIRSGAGSLSGAYAYCFTFLTPGGGETDQSGQVFCSPSNNTIALTNVPLGPTGSVWGRNIYRTASGGGALKLLATIPDNATNSYVDGNIDASLGAQLAPTVNTSQGIPIFEMYIESDVIPQKSPAGINDPNHNFLEITGAYKHLLTATQNTIPEKHWDAIVLGSEAHLLEAYLVTTNDNFDFVDGQFRDKVDDSRAPAAWRAQADSLMRRFGERLHAIRNEIDATAPRVAAWGDKPVKWDRV